VSVDALKENSTYFNLLYDLSGTPPLLSLLRKVTVDTGVNATYMLNLILLFISSGYLFNFAVSQSKKIYGFFLVFVYLFSPATWLYNTYEYDVGMYVSLSIILTVSLFDFLKDKDGSQKLRLFMIFIAGFLLSILSSKWSVIHSLLLIIFVAVVAKGYKAKFVVICLLSMQFVLPIKNFMLDGVFANSTWIGLNLSMDLYTFYMSSEKLAGLKNCDSREELFMSSVLGCRYLNASKSDYAISKERIVNSPFLYIEQGLVIFKKNWLEFPDNYINSGMSYERLAFNTYQKPGNGRFYWWFLNMIIYYLIPLLALAILGFRGLKNCSPQFLLSIIFISLGYATMSLINGIELGRMKFYSFGYILLLVPYFPGSISEFKAALFNMHKRKL
jgi:hypothetical protein